MGDVERAERNGQSLGYLDDLYRWLDRGHREAKLFDRLLFLCASAPPLAFAKLILWP